MISAGACAGAGCRIQIGTSEMLVWLQIRAFSPFIPGVDADDGVTEKGTCLGLFDQAAKPTFV
ncbi:hypothetical protein AA3990_1498 [Gluconobacter roseus NBRC 3990]|nr:hypothetical protein AA3990_1498 [Gluconobacter roseus NBRC 3990]